MIYCLHINFMSARRQKALHFNLQEGNNVPFHREHRSKRGRSKFSRGTPLMERHKRLKKGWDIFKI